MTNELTKRNSLARIAAAASALVVSAVIVLGAAAPASAATHRISASGFATKASCQRAEGLNQAQIIRKGGTIYAGSVCGWMGTTQKWGFDILYRL